MAWTWALWLLVPLAWLAAIWTWGRGKRDFRRMNPQLYEGRAALRAMAATLLVVVSFLPAVLLDPPWSLAALVLLGGPALGLGWAHAMAIRVQGHERVRQVVDRQARWARTRAYWLAILAATYATVVLAWAYVVTSNALAGLVAFVTGMFAGLATGRGLGAFVFLPPPYYPAQRRGELRWTFALPVHGFGVMGLASVSAVLAALVWLDRPGALVAGVLGLHAALGFLGAGVWVEAWRRRGGWS